MAYDTIGLGTSANDGTGDDLRTAGAKINDNFAKAVNNEKTIIPAAAMLPLTEDSAYYLESDVFPCQVFAETTTEGVKIQLFDVMNLIPAGATPKLKVKLSAYHDEDEPASRDVAWKIEAGWVGIAGVTFGTAQYVVQSLLDANERTDWSSQSSDITPGGTRAAGDELRLKISRDINYERGGVVQDTFDAPVKLYKIEIEWS
jgi:hypothetical protein